MLVNSSKWVFAEVHAQYTVALVTLTKASEVDPVVKMRGPFHSYADYLAGRHEVGELPAASITSATTGATFPMLPNAESADIVRAMRLSPRFDVVDDGWDFRPVAEFHATNDRKFFDAGGQAPGRWAVFTGASFNIWEPDSGEYYAWSDPATAKAALQDKRANQIRLKSSAFHGLSEEWADDPATLPLMHPRILFRDVTRSTDTRTMGPGCLSMTSVSWP